MYCKDRFPFHEFNVFQTSEGWMFQLHIFFSTLSVGCQFFFQHIAWSSLKGNHRNNITTCPWKLLIRALGRASQSQASQGSNASWVCGFVTMAMTNVKLCWPPWLEWGRHCICWELASDTEVCLSTCYLKRKTQVTGSLLCFTIFHSPSWMVATTFLVTSKLECSPCQ